GNVVARFLALNSRLHDLYCTAWIRSVAAIEFEGTFPVASLTYVDPELPVEVQAEIFSPFVPMDSRTSGTPGFYVYFSVKNLTGGPVEVSIMGVMRNAAGYDQDMRRPVNTLHDLAASTSTGSADRSSGKAVLLSAEGLEKSDCSTGDMTFAAIGGDVSYITGSFEDDHKSMKFHLCRYGLKSLTFLHQFRENGALPNLNASIPPQFREDFHASDLTESQRKTLLDELLQYPALYDKYQRIGLVDPGLVDSPDFLDELMDNIAHLIEHKTEWGWTALCSKLELAPEAEGGALFTVGWHFPNHISPTGANIGHMYEHWFSNSLDVVEHMVDNFADLRNATLALPEAIHNSSMPEEAADAVTSQLSTMTKCTWWTRVGDFGVWEGYGCCGFHTTDITYQGSFPIISLFPDLQKTQMELGARFQREDGRVHHFFTPDFSAVDNGFDRVDMNQQFVMLVARDYAWTGDKDYLDRLWPHVLRAMENTAKLDSDGDGLPDTDTRRNTYDNWDFSGCPSYISGLWLGALKAGIRLANAMGDKDRASEWGITYEMGIKSFESKLWNGDYYILWRDGDQVDECCMSDQMSGDWFVGTCGWGSILRPDRIRKALEAIVKCNFRENEGLLNAAYPPGKKRRIATFCNYQADAPWTGIEYTVAALLIDYGMVTEGMAIVRDIHQRYLQAGRFWSQVECGENYYRAMSSWTVLLALSGFRWDQPEGALTFGPAIQEQVCEYPFFGATAWGIYYQESGLTGKTVQIDISSGEMTVSKLNLPKLVGFENAMVTVGGVEATCSIEADGIGSSIIFGEPVVLNSEATLLVTALRSLPSPSGANG
ncbi:MAG: GH116 family glycosyl hydrolase, partial [Armatimonadota bacterium]